VLGDASKTDPASAGVNMVVLVRRCVQSIRGRWRRLFAQPPAVWIGIARPTLPSTVDDRGAMSLILRMASRALPSRRARPAEPSAPSQFDQVHASAPAIADLSPLKDARQLLERLVCRRSEGRWNRDWPLSVSRKPRPCESRRCP
jgi:hypothetical protein